MIPPEVLAADAEAAIIDISLFAPRKFPRTPKGTNRTPAPGFYSAAAILMPAFNGAVALKDFHLTKYVFALERATPLRENSRSPIP
jgi:hypothetical protein